jgi:xanthine/uracil permease
MSSSHDVKDDAPDRIGPDTTQKPSLGENLRRIVKAFTTKDGLVGTYDYAYLFKPNIPFIKKERRAAPFFGLNARMPVLLAMLLGFQHSLAMLAGIITPPIILSSAAHLDGNMQAYLVSTSLIVSGILSSIQISRFHIYRTPYYLGTGLLSVVGTSFATIPVATGALGQMYANGYCPSDADGNPLACPRGYGAILGTQCICALLEVLMSFTPPKILKRIFPPLVTGPTVLLIGVKLIGTGFANWAGGSNDCRGRPESGLFALCPNINAPKPLPWGSAEFGMLTFHHDMTLLLPTNLVLKLVSDFSSSLRSSYANDLGPRS